ncbi:MAG: neutral zinc metallopeptidase [Paracoccus sp. (in: a-proteobacteria)]|uniref:KPN_02809 family neutral zinc metallopeptidase n=1 Tax=Paracoccus sp. TaxID=267 RepID=UPI0026E01E2B|nr:neutral zinc metallopeptidase [Paracoccus sp. (in: a-proteobacteria)]MDO5621289.1 neutral zinc metallopeptidase [Paracoccus sp. (in: a-proteobacteria)]
MQWRGRRESRNIEDRRGMGAAGAGGVGVVGMLAVLAVGYFFGIDISPLVNQTATTQGQQGELNAEQREYGEFVGVVLADTENVWSRVLQEQAGQTYREPSLVLYSGVTRSACGGAESAMGPFYCPGDQKVYLDTDFFDYMQRRMGAGGDFAAAYVIAHEIGHHVQNQLGVLGQVNSLRARVSQTESNQLSVLTELQADCFAGIWARQQQDRFGTLEAGDIQEAMRAAEAVGDDVIQSNAGRVPMPDSFTHGSAEQRQDWFMRGYRSGQIASCNSFREAGL